MDRKSELLQIVKEVILEYNSDMMLLYDFQQQSVLDKFKDIDNDSFREYVETVVSNYERGITAF